MVAELGQYEQSSEIMMMQLAIDNALPVPFNFSASSVINIISIIGGFLDLSR